MIAIDTNVLLRHILQDDEHQSAKATRLIGSNDRVLVTDVVLLETMWTLRGKKYSYSHENMASVIVSLFHERSIIFENPQAVWSALRDFQEERPGYDAKTGRKLKLPDFADTLIINKARQTAKQKGEALTGIYTFDAGAQRISGVYAP